MIKFSLKMPYFFISILVLFLLTCQTQIMATRVDASTYGFKADDATTSLQAAIDSKADTVMVPNMGTDWIVKPIFCTSPNQVIIFEPGVMVTAKKGEFHGTGDCLFSIRADNVSLIGYGATFKMQKADYANPALYTHAEWRMCISVNSTGIKILGLTLKESGGDGIYVNGASNCLIKDVICDNNYRQGISVISASNLTIENCVLINTKGTAPQCGIDFEPGSAGDLFINGKMINCYVAANAGGGVNFSFDALNNTSQAIDIEIKHCFISGLGDGGGGTSFGIAGDGVRGTVSLEDCINEGILPWGGVFCFGKSANSYLATFTNCLWQYCNLAIGFLADDGSATQGGFKFINCTINEPDNQPTIVRNNSRGSYDVANIIGNIKVYAPYGAQSQLGTGSNVSLQITEIKTNPPVVISVKPDKGSTAKVTEFTAGDVINASAIAYDPDNGTADGSGISKVDFALWRGDNIVTSTSDVSAPYVWNLATTTQYERGIYMIRITAYSQDGSYTVAVVPINIYSDKNKQ